MFIYLKTHNNTGLKYLGFTTKDPFKYRGSGQYWKRHLSKHGNDITTKILVECNTREEARKVGIYYSDLWNVVESTEFANLIPETVDGTSGYHHTYDTKKRISKSNNGKAKSEEHKRNISKGRKGIVFSEEHKINIGIVTKGRPQTEETRKKRADSNRGQKRSDKFKK